MAQPSSSHHDDRERRHHHRSSSHHHHRTISSTTLLLVLSLVLAVLAVMLSLPSSQTAVPTGEAGSSSVWSYLTPKRSQALIAREGSVAVREAEVARREAELLAGAPGGIVPSPVACPPCQAATTIETITAPIQTVIKEIVKEDSLAPPGWHSPRLDDILDRELKIAEREREISRREENVNKREHDAARRESWIMEQLIALGNDGPTVQEEYVYDPVGKRKPKQFEELPPLIVSETHISTQTKTVVQTQFVTVPPAASTRLAASPAPVNLGQANTANSPRTTAVEVITEEADLPPDGVKTILRPRPTKWFKW